MARSTPSAGSRFTASPVATPSPFDRHVGFETTYDYWVSSSQPANVARRSRRSAPLANDIVAWPEESPRYYAAAWQILLWLACAMLAVLMMFD